MGKELLRKHKGKKVLMGGKKYFKKALKREKVTLTGQGESCLTRWSSAGLRNRVVSSLSWSCLLYFSCSRFPAPATQNEQDEKGFGETASNEQEESAACLRGQWCKSQRREKNPGQWHFPEGRAWDADPHCLLLPSPFVTWNSEESL